MPFRDDTVAVASAIMPLEARDNGAKATAVDDRQTRGHSHERFPLDFMLQLSAEDYRNLKFQSGTSSSSAVRKHR
jgi:hypothetical protein